jgi:acyl transferase domain-containing protein
MTLSSNILQTIKQQHLKQNLRRSYLTKPSSVRKVGILFPGQGAQHVGMGADIYKEFQVARQVIDECEETLGARLRHLMFEGPQVTIID